MITILTVGPFIDPLTPDERTQLHKFIQTAIDREAEFMVIQDRDIGCVWAEARIVGPEPELPRLEARRA